MQLYLPCKFNAQHGDSHLEKMTKSHSKSGLQILTNWSKF